MEQQEKKFRLNVTRRRFLTGAGLGIGSAALGTLLFKDQLFGAHDVQSLPLGIAQFAPKAK
ncbi:MAG: twin-arginine translocation signal domain-containing protein, partial [Bacteroidota bacterium]